MTHRTIYRAVERARALARVSIRSLLVLRNQKEEINLCMPPTHRAHRANRDERERNHEEP